MTTPDIRIHPLSESVDSNKVYFWEGVNEFARFRKADGSVSIAQKFYRVATINGVLLAGQSHVEAWRELQMLPDSTVVELVNQ